MKLPPRLRALVPVILVAVAVAGCVLVLFRWRVFAVPDATEVFRFYQQSLRASLFTGFLTLSGFLFSAKTFIVMKMHESVYSTPAYQKRARAEATMAGKPLQIYAPLRSLADLLLLSVSVSLLTSVSQLTIGLALNYWAVLWCLAIAAVAVVFIAWSVLHLGINLRAWFNALEESAQTAKPPPKSDAPKPA